MRFKLMLAMMIGLAVTLAGCATTAGTQTGYVQACGAYGSALLAAAQLREAGKLTPAQIETVSTIDSQVTPVCTGPLPADPQAATVQVTQAVTTLAVMAAVHATTKEKQ